MIISTLNAEPIGTIIFDGRHRPFHALACPLQAHLKQIHQKKEDNSSYWKILQFWLDPAAGLSHTRGLHSMPKVLGGLSSERTRGI